MKEVEVDSDIVKIAHEKAKKLGVVKRSITKGEGNSKQEAQTKAASKALKIKNWN